MSTQNHLQYNRIAEAIEYLHTHYQEQPRLAQVAEQVHLSPHHFQRLFTEWAGVSPKKFLQFISLAHAKAMLREKQATLFDTAESIGLSGTGRLHDLFIKMEGMTPAEYKNEGAALQILYSYADTPFGSVLVAATPKGVCHLAFADSEAAALDFLHLRFPKAQFQQRLDRYQQRALQVFTKDWDQLEEVKLHLKGTPFQLKVWECLLKIPLGRLTSYGRIAKQLENPKASRAVGSAVGDNPVAYLIPCHRVIQSSGVIGQYLWGSTRKTAMIGWEAARVSA